jgi:hypothetical protein
MLTQSPSTRSTTLTQVPLISRLQARFRALRYGGGRARSMSAGLYLLYPAFHTDVTDNCRLGRWARVRTDLAGFYFNRVFSTSDTTASRISLPGGPPGDE